MRTILGCFVNSTVEMLLILSLINNSMLLDFLLTSPRFNISPVPYVVSWHRDDGKSRGDFLGNNVSSFGLDILIVV